LASFTRACQPPPAPDDLESPSIKGSGGAFESEAQSPGVGGPTACRESVRALTMAAVKASWMRHGEFVLFLSKKFALGFGRQSIIMKTIIFPEIADSK
jgi:hypothetical protein